ncbi:NYN domain-containing protein [Myxococcota bacterium]|nr:NYN domain-containing protein [Myxococcota bacterium]
MRVALFFDGKNFYSGWKDRSERPEIDYEKLASWLVKRAGGRTLWGAHWYTGIDTSEEQGLSQQKLSGFLDMLEHRPGYFVHRLGRRSMTHRCTSCGHETRYTHDKEVDTSLVADMVRYAAINAYDVAVLLSGDGDHSPAIEAIQLLGKQAYVASWGGSGLSQRLCRIAFDHIDLLKGVSFFESSRVDGNDAPRFSSNSQPNGNIAPAPDAEDVFLEELGKAEEHFKPGFVGLNYFITRWSSPLMETSQEVRRQILDDLVEQDLVEVYEAANGDRAIRRIEPGSGGMPLIAIDEDED